MAKLSSFRKIKKEDVAEEYKALIEAIGYSINSFADEVISGFNRRLTIKENLTQDIVSIEVTVNSSGIPITESKFKNTIGKSLQGIKVIKAENLTNTSTYPTTAPFISFTQNGELVTINHISGLQSGNKYRLTINTIGA